MRPPPLTPAARDVYGYAPAAAARPAAPAADQAETVTTALPMAAMFTRQRMIGWASVIFAIQSWLNESPTTTITGKQPALFGVAMAMLGLAIVSARAAAAHGAVLTGQTYMPIFFPVPVPNAPAPAAPFAT